jgi:hypothetical protein
MIMDILIRFCILKVLYRGINKKNPWRQLNLLRNKSDEMPIQIVLMIVSSLPTSIIMYSSIHVEHRELIWPALIRILKLYRLNQLNLYFDVRDIRSKKDSFIRTI